MSTAIALPTPPMTHAGAKKEILVKFLLGSSMYDTISFEDFESLFPIKMRANPRIQTMYTAVAEKRNKIRTIVKRNIDRHCRKTQTTATPGGGAGAGQVTTDGAVGATIEETMIALRERSADLDANISEAEADCEEIKSSIASFQQSLVHGELQQLIPHGLDFDNTVALLQAMERGDGTLNEE